jgi:hypothetical protein
MVVKIIYNDDATTIRSVYIGKYTSLPPTACWLIMSPWGTNMKSGQRKRGKW